MRKTSSLALAGLALLPWAAFGATLTLKESVQQAMRVDPAMGSAHIALERSQLAVLRAQLDRVTLTVDAQVQELWNRNGIGLPADQATAVPPLQGLFSITGSLSIPLFSGLKVESKVARTQRQEEAQALSLEVTRKDLALSVARAYWSARKVAMLRGEHAKSVARFAEAEQVVSRRVTSGLAPPIDLNRAKHRRLQGELTLASLEGQEAQARAQLAVALGVAQDVELSDAPDVEAVARQHQGPVESLIARAHRDRPELGVARLSLEAQRSAVQIARSDYYPHLSAFGLMQFTNNAQILSSGSRQVPDVANPFTNLSLNVTVGATVSLNVFNFLTTHHAVLDALAEERRLAEEVRRVERAVETEVRVASAKLSDLLKRQRALVEVRELAHDNVAILEARYLKGEALVIELLDAQAESSAAALNLMDVEAQLAVAWLELQSALGTVVGSEGG